MPRQSRKASGTGIYHVMLRGINRQDIFEDDVQNLDKQQRNRIIKELCNQGGGFRQLARITGISFGIIQRAATDQSPLIYEDIKNFYGQK